MNSLNKRRGSGYLVVIMFAAILLILFMIFGRVKSEHQLLQSKDVRRFMATNLAESALNCIVAEMNANRAFNTHRYYNEKNGWEGPVKARETLIGEMEDLKLDGVKDGIYSGKSSAGEFKSRFALYYGARENSKTKTFKEAEMYVKVEVVSKIGTGWNSKDTTCRKISAFLERRFPANENLLYDGEVLDLAALGPYVNNRKNQLNLGRLYGYHYVLFNQAGATCPGYELGGIEKIETPGFIRAYQNYRIGFSNKTSFTLHDQNDSLNVENFKDHDGYMVDGAHGAHPIKLTRLPKERIKTAAHRFRKTCGITITKDSLPFGKYKNPYNPRAKYVDLDFGDYMSAVDEGEAGAESEGDGELGDEEDEGTGGGSVGSSSDDPEIVRKLPGDKIIIYSEVPLRIWGCPDKTITIYSLEDIVIAGDFNQSPLTSQVYENNNYIDYKNKIFNGKYAGGKAGNKVGAMVMSEKRVYLDMSRPSLFVKNEMKPYFLYMLAKNLHPSTSAIEREAKEALCPAEPSLRRELVGLGPVDASGDREPYYGTIAWLCKNPTLNGGGTYSSNMEDVVNFFTPGPGAVFGIQDAHVRNELIEDLKSYLRRGGDLTVDEQDRLFEKAWRQATIEEEKMPALNAGPMGLIGHLFEEAVKDGKDGIFVPEMTVNAGIVSSVWRASKWKINASPTKTEDEIGNVAPFEYMKRPGFVIQRIYGSHTRLGTNKPDYFVGGEHTGRNILRRRVWDSTNLSNAKFKPLECPAVHNLLTFNEEQISEKEYREFGL
jgi:hypothetical protein